MNRPGTSDSSFRVIDADWLQHADAIRTVRHTVFVLEQGIPAALEWDNRDPDCRHALALLDDGSAVATGRLQPDGRLGRMAVLAGWRGRGIGRAILDQLQDQARGLQLSVLYLHAQEGTAGFYQKAGFIPRGEAFEEAGIRHIEMVRQLD